MSFSSTAYKWAEQESMHSVFLNFPEIDNRVRPLRVNEVSYDLMQQIAAQSEIDLSTQSAPISEQLSPTVEESEEEEKVTPEEEHDEDTVVKDVTTETQMQEQSAEGAASG